MINFSIKLILILLVLINQGCSKSQHETNMNKNYIYDENGRIIPPSKDELKLIPKDGGDMWNRLAFETSPYLLQHAANPVDWYPWSEEAFLLAKKLDKPVFLSIGYTTCHWCHVMEHESFEDSLVAGLMNDTFVNIKVDREERPDIDNIYMEVTQMVTGRGGWPMTVIMTPDKKPFFAGTYFPKNSRHQRVGMIELIPEIKKIWQTKKDSIYNSADKITRTLYQRNSNRTRKADIKYLDVLESAFSHFSDNFDSKYGGFKGSRNKFPKAHDYSFLVRYYNRTNDQRALDIINKSLYAMKNSGMYDQVGFGFHRYSTDQKWLVPHFEKMLYDQAILINAYLDAYLVTKDMFFKESVDEIIEYVLRDMTSIAGGFYSAEDADTKGEEGLFYIWNTNELDSLLDTNEYEYLYDILSLNNEGNCKVEGQSTNIPHFTQNWKDISKKYNISIDDAKVKYHKIRNKVFKHREKRVHPQKDDKILTDWNGLMISALARSGAIFNNDIYINAAIKSADFIIKNLIDEDGSILKTYRNGPSKTKGMIEDYAFFIMGLIDLYQGTFNQKYLDLAQSLSEYQLEQFWDNENDGFYFTANNSEELLIRNKEFYDGAIPSGNSVSAYNYIRLSRLLSKPDFEDIANKIIMALSSNLNRYSAGYSMMLHALDFIEGPSYEVIIIGDGIDREVLNIVNSHQQINKIVIYKDSNEQISGQMSFLNNYFMNDDKTTIYVCKNYVCNLPTSDINVISKLLSQ